MAEVRRLDSTQWREVSLAIGVPALATLAALALRPYLIATNLAMFYLLGVVAVAMRSSRVSSAISSLISVAAFDFFCVPPYLTFRVTDYEHLITFAGMLVVAEVVSTQTARIRTQAESALKREVRTQALYELSRRLAGQTRMFEAARTAAELAEQVFDARVVIFLPEDGKISFRKRTSDQLLVSTLEEPIAQWVFDNGRKAGRGTRQMNKDAAALYLPLKGGRNIVGVMSVLAEPGSSALAGEPLRLLEVFANQTALAVERTLSQNAAEAARLDMRVEQTRSSLLSALSHDFRTPLASITGAASTLRLQGDRLPAETRDDLLESIADEADRLGRLVGNLLDMTRLESGVELRRDLYPLEEIVGTALQRVERQLEDRPIQTQIPNELSMVSIDDLLIGQVLINLIENAIKYSPPNSTIEIEAGEDGGAIWFEVRDRGAGFTPGDERRVFEKFYRGASGGARGAGLGLAICKAIVDAHRGSIEALNREGGGALVRVSLPLEGAR